MLHFIKRSIVPCKGYAWSLVKVEYMIPSISEVHEKPEESAESFKSYNLDLIVTTNIAAISFIN